MNKIKVIQSRLSRKNVQASLGEIREYIAENYGDTEINEEMMKSCIEHFTKAPLAASTSDITVTQKQELIGAVAKEIDVAIPVEAITKIANSIDWAIESRAQLMQELRVAVRAWANHKLEQASQLGEQLRQETEQFFGEIKDTISTAVEEDNRNFETQAESLSNEVNKALSSFRNSKAAILERFKIAS